jgi:hypothetical protein
MIVSSNRIRVYRMLPKSRAVSGSSRSMAITKRENRRDDGKNDDKGGKGKSARQTGEGLRGTDLRGTGSADRILKAGDSRTGQPISELAAKIRSALP